MGRVYQQAEGLRPLVDRLLREWHQHLLALEVRIDLLWAYEGSAHQPLPTLTLRGEPVAGIAAIEPVKRRAQDAGDVRIEVDLGRWQFLEVSQREALLDHELAHFEPVTKEGAAQFDVLDRPRIRIRRHDYELGGFGDIALRHGRAALEVMGTLGLLEGVFGAAMFPGVAGAGRVYQQAVTAGRAESADEYLSRPRYDVTTLRLSFERHHRRSTAARERNEEIARKSAKKGAADAASRSE